MSSSPTPRNIQLPPRRVFGASTIPDSALDSPDASPISPGRTSVSSSRFFSFGRSQQRRVSTRGQDEEANGGDDTGAVHSERPPIPSALRPAADDVYTTPLPILPMIVLSITMLGEFLSANVSTPFLLFMVAGFGGLKDEADIGYWTGVLVSVFFLTQFLTSLLWATVASKHGQRTVLFASLLGSALTCFAFGTATSLAEAIAIRLLQGVFAGAIGVARGSIASITDPSNEGRAYAILGFCWGLGGVAGAIIGGTLESPAKRWPSVFGEVSFFVNYPYVLPCAVAASITFMGSILSLFLAYDGGPREGAIHLPEKIPGRDELLSGERASSPLPIIDESEDPPTTVVGSIGRKMSRKFSDYFARRVKEASPSPSGEQDVPLSSSVPRSPGAKGRTFSRTSRADGSAYGYTGGYRNRLASSATLARRASMASTVRRRRSSIVEGHRASVSGETSEMNFAQRLLMANENAVTNIADLWVAAAMNVDNEDPFESDTEMGSDEEAVGEDSVEREEGLISALNGTSTRQGRPSDSRPLTGGRLSFSRRPSYPHIGSSRSPRRPSTSQHRQHAASPSRRTFSGDLPSPGSRRLSNAPAIFSHVGVRTPPAQLEPEVVESGPVSGPGGDALRPIMEDQPASIAATAPSALEAQTEKPPSLFSQLPIAIIVQYGLLALHTTTHDQVFVLYLLSPYGSGGLNLNSGDFSQLIAMMCLAQIAYQFYLYPNIGPPRGRFSHLSMFRIGSALFIPSYLSVILYRAFANAQGDGNVIVMTALTLSTALRYCGSTFAYTSVSILLNYMAPTPVLGLANGMAQSIVSLARFFGPVFGGYLWSVSVQDNPAGYPLGFFVCSVVCALAVAHSFIIR